MPRVKIDVPATFCHESTIQVRVSDLNYGNHLGNDRLLAYVQEARVLFLASQDKSELNFWGTSLIQGDASITYQNEGFLHDEIKIEIAVADIGNSSFDLVYRLTNITTSKPLAMVKTRMVCFDYNNRKVTKVPEAFKKLFG